MGVVASVVLRILCPRSQVLVVVDVASVVGLYVNVNQRNVILCNYYWWTLLWNLLFYCLRKFIVVGDIGN